jgi:integrase
VSGCKTGKLIQRVSEGVRLTTSDIDGKRNLLRVRDGKGGKDRNVPLHKHAQELLRVYYRKYGEGSVFLYPHKESHIRIDTLQVAFIPGISLRAKSLSETIFIVTASQSTYCPPTQRQNPG